MKISNSQFDKFSISGGVAESVPQILELLKYNSDIVYFDSPQTTIRRELIKKTNPITIDPTSENLSNQSDDKIGKTKLESYRDKIVVIPVGMELSLIHI